MAALLHDVGHGLCSHASEQIYEALTDIQDFKRRSAFAKNAPGEILSHLIVKSPTFRNWFTEFVMKGCHSEIDLDTVAQIILGTHPRKELYFLSQIVSSPYDADKLDYIARDSYYCGLALTVDLARFYGMISITKHRDFHLLVLRNYVPLEQILFSKMTLFGSVYHHPKVKCLDSMLRSLIRHVAENSDQCSPTIRGKRVSFSEPTEYLYATDEEFFNQVEGFGDDFVKKMLARFRRRDLFVRCLEISRRTVKNWDDYHRKGLMDLSADPQRLHNAERSIYMRLKGDIKGPCNLGEVLLSIPAPPTIKSDFAYIQSTLQSRVESVEEFFPVEQWIEAYAHNKWKGFVYGPREYAKAIRDSAVSFLKDEMSISIDVGRSNSSCHL